MNMVQVMAQVGVVVLVGCIAIAIALYELA
jgi:hypothetical protein